MSIATKTYRLGKNYLFDRMLGRPSTASFWYLAEIPRLKSHRDFDAYVHSAGPSPHYVMDYAAKLRYTHANADGIIVLPYGDPIGDQINPEACFIQALALHDAYLESEDVRHLEKFMTYARWFSEHQTDAGDWTYDFDWPGSKAPWWSALAQGRGVSVMIRAWLVSGDETYLDCARLALSRFNTPIENGGYLAAFGPDKRPYFEEYPSRPIGVLNGFMASLIGCWELSHWAEDDSARDLFERGIDTLAVMAPAYLTAWWSVYDLNPEVASPNLNTPRYHRLCISYLQVLSVLSKDQRLADMIPGWEKRDTRINRLRATAGKFIWKLRYGIFTS